jgi:hypothetical protein
MIFENVNDESLVKFKETSREMSEFLVKDRFYWLRILKKYNQIFDEFSKAWKMFIGKTPVNCSYNFPKTCLGCSEIF